MYRRIQGRGELPIVLLMTSIILVGIAFIGLKVYFGKVMGVLTGVHFLGYDLAGLRGSDVTERIEKVLDFVYAEPVYMRLGEQVWILRNKRQFKLQYDAKALAAVALKIGKDRSVSQMVRDWVSLDYPRIDVPFIATLDRKFTEASLGARFSLVTNRRVYAKRVPGLPVSTPTVGSPIAPSRKGPASSRPVVRPEDLPQGQIEVVYQAGEVGLQALVDTLDASFRKDPLPRRREVKVALATGSGSSKRQVEMMDPAHGFSVILASKETPVRGLDPASFEAVVSACQSVNGTILNPGESFSFRGLAGARTVWASAARTSGIGLGLVSSLLYEPLLRSGVKVVERHPHRTWSKDLEFCEPGLDASLQDPGWDMKVLNEVTLPLLIVLVRDRDRLACEIRSVQELQHRLDLEVTTITKIPFKTTWLKTTGLTRDAQVVRTAGIEGRVLRVLRYWESRNDGRKERIDRIAEETIPPRHAVIEVGPQFMPPPEPKATPKPRPTPAPEPDDHEDHEAASTDDDDTAPSRPASVPDAASGPAAPQDSMDEEELPD